ncbi:MAG TPA: hypothetical protein VFM55_00635 [Micromonosporaceae bacterium]|nr:hypothetical protein [Micromonosporaceae bacterium]
MSSYSTVQLPPVAGGAEPPAPPPPRRRGLRTAFVAMVAVLVLAVPLVLYLVLRGDSAPEAGSPPAVPQPTASAPAPPAAAPTAAPTQQAPAPDGRIPLALLRNATLDIPAWPADNMTGPSGRLTFRDGEATPPSSIGPHVLLRDVTYGDVDRDGAQETLAEIDCVIQGGSQQVVAFDRNAAGRIVTLGTVVATTGEVRTIDGSSMRVLADGTISVKVADYQQCCGDETPQLWQTRGYRWNGHEFRQVSGPTSFPVNPAVTETGVKAGPLVFGPAVDGVQRGTLTVTVSYLRGTRPDHLTLHFTIPDYVQRDGSAWPPVRTGELGRFSVDLPTPALGGSRTYTFAFRRTVTGTGGDFSLHLFAMTKQNAGLGESNPFNNGLAVTFRSAG